jgi:hypothetical protein
MQELDISFNLPFPIRHIVKKALPCLCLSIAFLQLGCSSLVQKVAVGTTSSLLFEATGEIET